MVRGMVEAQLAALVPDLGWPDVLATPEQANRLKAHRGCVVSTPRTVNRGLERDRDHAAVNTQVVVMVAYQVAPGAQRRARDEVDDLGHSCLQALTDHEWYATRQLAVSYVDSSVAPHPATDDFLIYTLQLQILHHLSLWG